VVEPKDFVKASKYDASRQRHNRAVFAGWLRARPIAAVALSGVFVALGIGVLLAPNPRGRPAWIVSALALMVAAYLLAVTFHRRGAD
jgi:O-antigen/teichoic acid export membrane protein